MRVFDTGKYYFHPVSLRPHSLQCPTGRIIYDSVNSSHKIHKQTDETGGDGSLDQNVHKVNIIVPLFSFNRSAYYIVDNSA